MRQRSSWIAVCLRWVIDIIGTVDDFHMFLSVHPTPVTRGDYFILAEHNTIIVLGISEPLVLALSRVFLRPPFAIVRVEMAKVVKHAHGICVALTLLCLEWCVERLRRRLWFRRLRRGSSLPWKLHKTSGSSWTVKMGTSRRFLPLELDILPRFVPCMPRVAFVHILSIPQRL